MNKCYQFVFVICYAVYSTYQKECIPLITDFSQKVCIDKAHDDSTYYYSMKDSNCIPTCDKYRGEGHNRESCPCPPAYSCQQRCKGTTAHSKISCKTIADCPRGARSCASMCISDRNTCMAYHANTTDFRSNVYTAQKFKPACDNNGDWSAKQCKGGVTGRCFCYDKKGKRLFGEATYDESTDMTCACSRKKADLVASGRFYVSMHCDSTGNFEPLQCDSGLCWCVEPKSGELISTVVPQKAMSKLPCYGIAEIGTQYLRQCDSIKYAMEKIANTLKLHGVQYCNMGNVVCDGDGAYGKYNVSKGISAALTNPMIPSSSQYPDATETQEMFQDTSFLIPTPGPSSKCSDSRRAQAPVVSDYSANSLLFLTIKQNENLALPSDWTRHKSVNYIIFSKILVQGNGCPFIEKYVVLAVEVA